MILCISPKNIYFTNRLVAEAKAANVELEVIDIKDLATKNFEINIALYNTLYIRFCYPYFEQTVKLAKRFKAAGKKVVDAAIAEGDLGHGKMRSLEILQKNNLPIPKTEWLITAKAWQYPTILKWDYGFGGKNVFLVNGAQRLGKVTKLLPPEEILLQQFIPAEFEYKVITVGYKSLPVVLKFAVDKKTWRPDYNNFSVIKYSYRPALDALGTPRGFPKFCCKIRGPRPPILGGEWAQSPPRIGGVPAIAGEEVYQVISLAEAAARALNRELSKVDILEAQGQFYILEANRWPGLKSFEEVTKYNVVKDFLAYLNAK